MIQALSRGVYYAATMVLFGDAAFGVLLRTKLPIIAPLRVWSLRWGALLVALLAALPVAGACGARWRTQ